MPSGYPACGASVTYTSKEQGKAAGLDAGNHVANVTALQNSNYKLKGDAVKTQDYTINKYAVAVT